VFQTFANCISGQTVANLIESLNNSSESEDEVFIMLTFFHSNVFQNLFNSTVNILATIVHWFEWEPIFLLFYSFRLYFNSVRRTTFLLSDCTLKMWKQLFLISSFHPCAVSCFATTCYLLILPKEVSFASDKYTVYINDDEIAKMAAKTVQELVRLNAF